VWCVVCGVLLTVIQVMNRQFRGMLRYIEGTHNTTEYGDQGVEDG
jgi:hypothetical protein